MIPVYFSIFVCLLFTVDCFLRPEILRKLGKSLLPLIPS